MATPTPIFPSAIATDSQLKVANNLIQTTLRTGIDGVNTILFVASSAGFVANSLVSIDNEIIAIEAVTGAPNPALVVAASGRGFDGTSAAAHSADARVRMLIDAWHHNVLAAEVKALETFIGPNGQNLAAGSIQACAYDFAPQLPGGTLAVGNNVITLSPVPRGVNGTDASHYLYIDQGTGTAEAALITGGTAVSGAASGTVIVNCANTHSGSWRIRSATGGIQEAINSAGTGTPVLITCSMTVYAPAAINKSLTIQGYSDALITVSGSPSSVLVIAADHVTIAGCRIAAGNAARGITDSGSHADISIARNTITGGDYAVRLTGASQVVIYGNNISGVRATCIASETSVANSYVTVINNYVSSVGSTVLNGGGIGCWGSYTAIIGNVVRVGGNQDQGIVWINSPGNGLTGGIISGNVITLETASAFEAIGIGSAMNFAITGNVVRATVVTSGPAACYGIEINNASMGLVSGNSIYLNNPTTPTAGIILESAREVVVEANSITGWGPNAGSMGIGLTHTSNSIQEGGELSRVIVANNVLRQTAPTGAGAGIRVETLASGTAVNNKVVGNSITGNNAAGMTGLKITNSGLATMTGFTVSGNDFNACPIPIEVPSSAVVGFLADNRGIDDVMNTSIAAAATVTLGSQSLFSNYVVTGTTPIATINGGWVGRQITLRFTDAAPGGVVASGNIYTAKTAAQNATISLRFDGTKWMVI